jgi:hypothetical protein
MDSSSKIIIMQNELFNIVSNNIQTQGITEKEMLIILQGVELKVANMALTRENYNAKHYEEVISDMTNQEAGKNE